MCVRDVAAEDDAAARRCAASLISLHSPARLGQAHAAATPKVSSNAAESMRCLATPPPTRGEHDNTSLGRTRDHTAPHRPAREAVGRRVDNFATSRDSHFVCSITHLHKHQNDAWAVRRRRNSCTPGWGRFNLLVAVACISFTAAQVTGEDGTNLWNVSVCGGAAARRACPEGLALRAGGFGTRVLPIRMQTFWGVRVVKSNSRSR